MMAASDDVEEDTMEGDGRSCVRVRFVEGFGCGRERSRDQRGSLRAMAWL
jgi:hypothetical protein